MQVNTYSEIIKFKRNLLKYFNNYNFDLNLNFNYLHEPNDISISSS